MIFVYLNSNGRELDKAISALRVMLDNDTPYLIVTDNAGLEKAATLPFSDFLSVFEGQNSRLHEQKKIFVVASRPIPRFEYSTQVTPNENVLGLLESVPNGFWINQLIQMHKEEIDVFLWCDQLLSGLHTLEKGVTIYGKPSYSI